MNTNLNSQETKQQSQAATATNPAADTPLPGAPTPEQVVEQLRTLRQQIGEEPPLTQKQRNAFRDLIRVVDPSVQTSISVIGASDGVSQAVGQPADQVRQKVDVSNRWTSVEDELRAMLSSISDANLKRRHEIALLSAQAYTIGTSLARNPENGGLKPHLKEIKRLRSLSRRKKGASVPQTPAPETPAPSAPSSTPSTTSSSTPVAPSAPAAASTQQQS
jgi:hypothetical protein